MNPRAKQSSVLIIALCWLAYTVAYIGRLNFNAYIEPIRHQLGASKTELGLVSSFFFFSYGAGQLFHGILSQKYNTRYSVALALVGSAGINIAMAYCTNAGSMKYLWLINGFFQSVLWSSIIKTMADALPEEMLPKVVMVISTPPALGTFLIYGMAALFSSLGAAYKIIFLMPAILLIIIAALWFFLLRKTNGRYNENDALQHKTKEKNRTRLSPAFLLGAVLLLGTAVVNGFIKDGVTTWTPSILKERFGMQESLSILITVILPLIAVTGAWFSTRLHQRWRNSSALNAGLYLAETGVLLCVLLLSKNSRMNSPLPLILLFSISAMLMSAVNNIITSIIPLYMRDSMAPGLLAGVLDTFCYVGSALSTGVLGYIADQDSWNGVFLCLFLFGAAAFILCIFSTLHYKNEVTYEKI